MDIRELRVGNYVSHRGIADVQVNLNTFSNDYMTIKDFEIQGINPIPLTEEWLLRLGFRKLLTKENFFIINEDTKNEFLYNIFNKDLYIDTGLVVQHLGVEINYVHQLQNLYFALTGTELTLK